MRRAGFSLIGVLLMISLLVMLWGAVTQASAAARARQTTARADLAARLQAQAGLDLAQGLMRSGRWGQRSTFRSPLIDGGYFEVRVEGSRLVSTGYCVRSRVTLEGTRP